MLDYISKQLKERFGTEDTSRKDESQMNEAVLEYAHLFQELDDLTMDGTEANSSRPFTKIDIPLEDDVEIDTVELNLLDGRVTDVPSDATVQEHSVLYNRMKTYDEFYQEAYSINTPYPRETHAQFEHRVAREASAKFNTYKNQLIQEGLFGFDKIDINDRQVPAKITLDFGKMGSKDTNYYVKLPVKYQVDKKHRILLKQLHSVQQVQNDDKLVDDFRQLVFNLLGEKAGVTDEDHLWDNITPVEVVVPVDPADQYCVAIGFEIDGSEQIEYIEWMAPVKGNKKPEQPGRLVDGAEIQRVQAITKGKAVQEMAVPKKKPSRFFQEAIDFGNPDEAPAADPNATSISFDDTGAAPAADTQVDAAPADGQDQTTPPDQTATDATGTDDKEKVDPNDVSAEIADKIADDTQNQDDINVDDVNVDASVDGVDDTTSSDTDIDADLNSMDTTDVTATDDTSAEDTSSLDFDNMTVDELLSQGSEKLKGMTIQQLKDFLNSPDGTPPPTAEGEATQEAFFITRGNVGKELDIHLRKTLGILNNNDMDINEICGAFRKEGKQLNRVAHKASKMKKLFNETEIKQLQRLNACLSDLLSMMRADIDQNSIMTVKRMIQAFVAEATGVAKMLEKKRNPGEPVQEAMISSSKKSRLITDPKHVYDSLSIDKITLMKKHGLFGNLFKKHEKEDNTKKLPENFPISENELMRIVKAIDDETAKPCVRFSFTQIEKGSVKPDDSVLGGLPPYVAEVPVDSKGRQLKFLIQINLADVPSSKMDLPKKGILQFWTQKDMDDMFGGNTNAQRIVYLKDTSAPSRVNELDMSLYDDYRNSPLFNNPNQYRISFKLETTYLPPYTWDEVDDYFKIFMDKWNKIVSDPEKKIQSAKQASDIVDMIPKGFCDHFDHKNQYSQWDSKIGGYPGFTQSDFRSNDWTPDNSFLLLQLDSDSKIMQWGDCGSAQWFIKKDDLKKLNFNNVLFDWACY